MARLKKRDNSETTTDQEKIERLDWAEGSMGPGELWTKVNAARIRLGLSLRDIGKALGTGPGPMLQWADYGSAPNARVLIAAERWVDANTPPKED